MGIDSGRPAVARDGARPLTGPGLIVNEIARLARAAAAPEAPG